MSKKVPAYTINLLQKRGYRIHHDPNGYWFSWTMGGDIECGPYRPSVSSAWQSALEDYLANYSPA